METEDFSVVNVCDTVGCDVTVAGNGMDLFGEEVGAHKDCVVSMGIW